MKHSAILRRAVERIKLDQSVGVSKEDKKNLLNELNKLPKGNEVASHIENMSPIEIEDLIVNLYN